MSILDLLKEKSVEEKENFMYSLNNFIDRVKIELNKATIKNKIYLIKFDFGSNSKTFKYKRE